MVIVHTIWGDFIMPDPQKPQPGTVGSAELPDDYGQEQVTADLLTLLIHAFRQAPSDPDVLNALHRVRLYAARTYQDRHGKPPEIHDPLGIVPPLPKREEG